MTAMAADWRHRLGLYARLARLDRPIGNFLLLWPTLWALWLAAEGFPRADVLIVFVLGVLVMRATRPSTPSKIPATKMATHAEMMSPLNEAMMA